MSRRFKSHQAKTPGALIFLSTLFVMFAAPARAQQTPGKQSLQERATVQAWAEASLLKPQVARPMPIGLQLRRQDHAQLQRRQSVLKTPLQIGATRFEHGLGTHAQSEIVLRLPQPAQRFEAQIGVDNNLDTKARHGSVVFVVEAQGREIYRSELCRGGEAPRRVQVELEDARDLTLRVLDGGDGQSHDQADWAEASLLISGRRVWLDELPRVENPRGWATEIPFSFTLGGQSSAQLLPHWVRSQRSEPMARGSQRHTVSFSDPQSKLEVRCEATLFADSPAVEWVLFFHNGGTADAPLLEAIRPLDLRVQAPHGDITLHRAHGSTNAATDFMPITQKIAPNAGIDLAPNGGRSSDGVLPFFNLEWRGGGLSGAIGWSGQWAMHIGRNGQAELNLQAGQQTTRLKLPAGETLRTPRILLLHWSGQDRMRGHNLLRRLLLKHYVPRQNNRPIVPPLAQNTWFSFNSGNDVNEANQLAAIDEMARLGVEAYWLDAGWFEGGWPSGVGSWVPRADAFPRGLKPLADAAHGKGMKFVLWFEPERVSPGSRIAREHPDWVLHAGAGDGLFDLGNDRARQWLTDLLSRCIAEWRVDVFRHDFNIDPLRFWQAADARVSTPHAPARQGWSEARYITGLYTMWDELRRRHPNLTIDNCASGGRRIDLETTSRSYPLWRSDTATSGRALPVWDQTQSAGLSLFVPVHASGLWDFDPYTRRSVATQGVSLSMNPHDKAFSSEQARRGLLEIKALRPLYEGDYYPLLDINSDEHHWCAWQFDRPEIGRGFALFFRRAQSPYPSVPGNLRALEANANYEVTFADEGKTRKMSGAALSRMTVAIASAPGSALIIYRRLHRK